MSIERNGLVFERVIIWFSKGAASFVAGVMALEKYGEENCEVVYQETNSEEASGEKFLTDFEKFTGVTVTRLQSEKYHDIWDVFAKTNWLVGPSGARCTSELKRIVAENYLNFFEDLEVLGYTVDEKIRVDRWIKNNNERFIDPILIEAGLTKEDCFQKLAEWGIDLPLMYKLGYRNNNCIGCVKGQQGYWNKIRVDFPDVFERMSKEERRLNAAINKRYEKQVINGESKNVRIRVFLDELDPTVGRYNSEPPMTCGFLCGTNEGTDE